MTRDKLLTFLGQPRTHPAGSLIRFASPLGYITFPKDGRCQMASSFADLTRGWIMALEKVLLRVFP